MVEHAVSHEELMRFLDDELTADRRVLVAAHLEVCTECNREIVVFRAMKADLLAMVSEGRIGPSIWADVNRHIMRPTGWIMVVVGAVALTAYAVWAYLTSPESFWEKLAVGTLVIGLVLLLLSALIDRLRDLRTDPYQNVHR